MLKIVNAALKAKAKAWTIEANTKVIKFCLKVPGS